MQCPAPGRAALLARYLGPYFAEDGRPDAEVRLRVAAANRGLRAMGDFRHSRAPWAAKRLNFICLVQGAVLTGLTALVLEPLP